jgi:hypothetical protein
MREILAAAALVLVVAGCDGRVLYTVEGVVRSSADDAPIEGVRVECAIADDPEGVSEGVSDEGGAYACTAVLQATGPARGSRAIALSFLDEDDAQNGAFQPFSTEVVVGPDGAETLDVVLDPA